MCGGVSLSFNYLSGFKTHFICVRQDLHFSSLRKVISSSSFIDVSALKLDLYWESKAFELDFSMFCSGDIEASRCHLLSHFHDSTVINCRLYQDSQVRGRSSEFCIARTRKLSLWSLKPISAPTTIDFQMIVDQSFLLYIDVHFQMKWLQVSRMQLV